MSQVVTFVKGMYPDIDPLQMEEGAYLEAKNMMRDSRGSLVTESGTTLLDKLNLGPNSEILGLANVGDDIVIVSIRNNISEVGYLDIQDNYHVSISDNILGFKEGVRIGLETKVDYRGHRIVYLAGKDIKLRSIDLDSIPLPGDLDKSTMLFMEFDLPVAELDTVVSGGKVPSGVYQFCARLVTESNNTTSFGPISGVIPIGVGTISDGRKNITGADPQTPTQNSIVVKVSNIDRAFKYIEVCVVTYEGESNQVRIRSLGKKSIDNQISMNVSYSGALDEKDIILPEELSIDNVLFESGEYITQKDNTLLIGGLKEYDNEFDWQSVANSIVMSYYEYDIPYREDYNIVNAEGTPWKSLTDNQKYENSYSDVWKDIALGGNYEDYKNPKTCEKFKGYRREEVYSFTFTPIFKGGRKGDAYHITPLSPAEVLSLGGSTTNLLRYVQTEGFTYSSKFGSLKGKKVRYHKMPDNTVSPFYKGTKDNQFIVALGIKSDIRAEGDWKDMLDGYIIGRESRKGKETVLAQGMCKDIYKSKSGNDYTIVPSYGNCSVSGTDDTNLQGDQYHKKIVTYHCPDFITDKNTNFIPSEISRIATFEGDIAYANTADDWNGGIANGLIVCNPNNVNYYSQSVIKLTGGIKTIQSASVDPEYDNPRTGGNNDNISVSVFDVNIQFRRLAECSVIQGVSNIPRVRGTSTNPNNFFDYWNDKSGGNKISYNLYQGYLDKVRIDLYNLKVSSANYYGDLFDKESIPVKTVIFSKGSVDPKSNVKLPDTQAVSFEGDTFISRYALTFVSTGAFYGTVGDNHSVPKTGTTVYIMLESDNNYNYRHYRENEDSNTNTLPFYPKFKTLFQENVGINNQLAMKGNSELYNKQYSAQNSLKLNYTGASDFEQILNFPNRIVYSDTSIEGEKFDAFKLFLPGNYHDIPKQFGSITGLFTMGTELFVHTERCLWRSFYNSLATQATSEGDIVMGNGGAFPRPSVPIVSLQGGYAGCKDISASVGTPGGRYFIDAYSSKMFMLGGESGLAEVTNPAVFNRFRDRAYGKDFVLGYDKGRKRILASSDTYTISYSPELSSFSSEHSYNFKHFISRDTKDFMVGLNTLEFIDDKVVGKYFNVVYNSYILFPVTGNPLQSKRFTSMHVNSNSFDPQSLRHKPFKFYDRLEAYSYERHVGSNHLSVIENFLEEFESLGQVFVHKVNNTFRLGIPPDIVYDINSDVHDPQNWVTAPGFTDDDRILLPDFIDNHIVIKLTQLNSDPRIMKTNSIIVNFEQNIT